MISLSKFSLRSVEIGAALLAATACLSPAAAQVNLDEVVVTPGGRPEPRGEGYSARESQAYLQAVACSHAFAVAVQ